MLGLTIAHADTIHVPGDASTIQAGVNLAVDGDEVVVGDGTWTGAGNRDIDLGGRVITVRSAGGPDACTLDCDYLGRAFTLTGGETLETRIEGFTFLRAAVGGVNQQGGGIRVELGAGLTVRNCVFDTCRLGRQGKGAGIWAGGPLLVEDCTFVGNGAIEHFALGGAIMAAGPATIRRTTFFDDTVPEGQGGAIHAFDTLLVEDCSFDQCVGKYGGAIAAVGAETVVTGSSFTDGFAYSYGGAIRGSGALRISDTRFIGNSSPWGGAIMATGAGTTVDLRNVAFHQNAAGPTGGGAVFLDDATMVNCLFTGNHATGPGGAARLGGASSAINCTFTANFRNAGVGAGGIEVAAGTTTVVNTILWGNDNLGVQDQSAQLMAAGGVLAVDHCDIEGLDGSLGGDGNIGEDPQFVDPVGADAVPGSADDDLRLLPGSPAIDAGRDDAVPADVTGDLDGAPRIAGAAVDMGAYEATSCPADIDGSGAIDLGDLLGVLGAWGPCDGCGADIDGDQIVGLADLLAILGAWGPC
jgi:hypothetical protein